MDTKTTFDAEVTALEITVLFTVLRACGIVDWPWWILMLPLFIEWGVVFLATVTYRIRIRRELDSIIEGAVDDDDDL